MPETATPRPLLEKLESLEGERQALEAQAAALNVEATTSRTVAALTEEDVRSMLVALAESVPTIERGALKALLRSQIRRITLEKGADGGIRACFDYAIPVETGVSVASPRGAAPNPTTLAVRKRVVFRLPKAGARRMA